MSSKSESFDMINDGLKHNFNILHNEIEEEIQDVEILIKRIKDKLRSMYEIINSEFIH